VFLSGKKLNHEGPKSTKGKAKARISLCSFVLLRGSILTLARQIIIQLRQVHQQAQDCRIFTVGIDRAVNASLLERLAAYGGGHCELVESEDRLDEVLRAMHRRLGAPLLTDVRLEPICSPASPCGWAGGSPDRFPPTSP